MIKDNYSIILQCLCPYLTFYHHFPNISMTKPCHMNISGFEFPPLIVTFQFRQLQNAFILLCWQQYNNNGRGVNRSADAALNKIL